MAVNEGDSVRIDILDSSIIDRLESSIRDMMPHHLLVPPKCCIYKTPAILYRHNEKAFIPNAFSIGPLHHANQKLNATEKIKAKYLQGLISRSPPFPDTILKTLISSIMEVEKDARECYAEAINYNAEQLVKILVVDGCFLIELFRRKAYPELRSGEEHDPIFTRSGMLQFLYHDLILLENQVPWMVLERLFNLTKDPSHHEPLITLAMIFMKTIFLSNTIDPKSDQCTNIKGIKHFVDLFRKLLISSSINVEREDTNHFVDLYRKLLTPLSTLFRKWSTSSSTKENQERLRGWELPPSATSLVEAGIKFKRGKKSQNLLDIKFNDGVLEIPPLVIHEVTETIFRNLISYEQCQPKFLTRITSYAVFLDSLINTAEDMDILCENEIIDNWLNPNDAAQLFNKLYRDTLVAYRYTYLCRQLKIFRQRRYPRWRAVLVRNYFDTPWAILSTSAAVTLLILTFVQTIK